MFFVWILNHDMTQDSMQKIRSPACQTKHKIYAMFTLFLCLT